MLVLLLLIFFYSSDGRGAVAGLWSIQTSRKGIRGWRWLHEAEAGERSGRLSRRRVRVVQGHHGRRRLYNGRCFLFVIGCQRLFRRATQLRAALRRMYSGVSIRFFVREYAIVLRCRPQLWNVRERPPEAFSCRVDLVNKSKLDRARR